VNDGKKLILFLSTYPPRECGIATFTQDLITQLQKNDRFRIGIVAVSDADYTYPSEVVYKIEQYTEAAYKKAADWINNSGASLLMIEHEYGIFGGRDGGYILQLVKRLSLPYEITLHTVLPDPRPMQLTIIRELAAGCRHVVTMSPLTVGILQDVYKVPSEKIFVNHHGIPEIPVPSRAELKKEFGVEGRIIVSTFGLLSPGKGIEYGLRAVAKVSRKHPEILYFVLGRTHPIVQKRYGEKYREKLENIVAGCHCENNVRFVNKYLSKEDIVRYLQASDMYLTPYLGKDQAVSGTLAYAIGYGRVIISTPYMYAKSMLADGRGLLGNFRDAASLAACITRVIEHPDEKERMEKQTLLLGREMRWSRVAEKYDALFTKDSETGKNA
jgi:glycosyltransferase involved in cell wall biosynthesis